MTAHQGIRATSSTAGTPSPGIAHLSGGYRYNKDPDWFPGHPRYREDAVRPPKPVTSPGRAERLAEYARLRDVERLTVTEAGERLGIRPKTAQAYERDSRPLRKQQQGGVS